MSGHLNEGDIAFGEIRWMCFVYLESELRLYPVKKGIGCICKMYPLMSVCAFRAD